MMDLVVGMRAEGIMVEVERLVDLGGEEGVAELGATGILMGISLNRLIYKNNSKILFRKLIYNQFN